MIGLPISLSEIFNSLRKPLLSLLTITSVTFSAHALAADNLFANPTFAESLWGWNVNVVNPNEDSIRWVSDGGDGMKSAARFYTDGKENPAWHMQLAQSKTVIAGYYYILSFDVATTSQYDHREVTLYMQEDGGKWAIIAEQKCGVANMGITRCVLPITMPRNGKVNFGIKGADNLWDFTVDNAELIRLDKRHLDSKTVTAGDFYELSFNVSTTSLYERDIMLYMQEDDGKRAVIAKQWCSFSGEVITRCRMVGVIPDSGKVNFGIQGADSLWDFTLDKVEVKRLDNRRVDSLHFPDPSLAAIVAEKQATYVYEITELNCANPYWGDCRIKDMSGIEELTALKSLQIWLAEFPAIDLSPMVELETLVLESSRLQTLDLSHNKSLINLSINAPVSTLALNKNPSLISLDLSGSGVSQLDLSNNPKLESISLGFMDCDSLLAIQQQFPNMESLTHVRCFLPKQKKPLVAELPFNDFFLRACVQEAGVDYVEDLKTLRCAYEARDYGRGTNIRDFTGLGQLNALSVLDLDAYYDIDQIDFSKNTKLKALVLSHMGLSSLDLSANSELVEIVFLGGFYGEELNLSNNHNLHSIWMRGGSMGHLVLPEQSNLRSIFFLQTDIASIDLSKQPNLTDLTIMETQITSIDISKNLKLKEFILVGEYYYANESNRMQFDSLDLHNNAELEILDVGSVAFPSLDLSGNPKLTRLNLNDNNLQSINLSNNKVLTEVRITDNPCLTIRSARHQLDPSIKFTVGEKCSPQNIPVADIRFPDKTLQYCFDKHVAVYGWKSLADVTSFECRNAYSAPVLNTSGIEQLTELKSLDLDGHLLDTIDLKSNTLLTTLNLARNNFSKIDFSTLVNLRSLWLTKNPLTPETIEAIKQLPALKSFYY